MINKIIQAFKRLKSYRQNMNPTLRRLDNATFFSIVALPIVVALALLILMAK